MRTFLLTALLLLAWGRSFACSCVGETKPESHQITKSFTQSGLVFIGRVLKAEPLTVTDSVYMPTQQVGRDTLLLQRREIVRYTFAVMRLVKGENVDQTVVLESNASSAACGVNFAVGSEQLLYSHVIKGPAAGRKQPMTPPRYGITLCNRYRELRSVKSAEIRQLKQMARKASGEHRFTWFELGD